MFQRSMFHRTGTDHGKSAFKEQREHSVPFLEGEWALRRDLRMMWHSTTLQRTNKFRVSGIGSILGQCTPFSGKRFYVRWLPLHWVDLLQFSQTLLISELSTHIFKCICLGRSVCVTVCVCVGVCVSGVVWPTSSEYLCHMAISQTAQQEGPSSCFLFKVPPMILMNNMHYCCFPHI